MSPSSLEGCESGSTSPGQLRVRKPLMGLLRGSAARFEDVFTRLVRQGDFLLQEIAVLDTEISRHVPGIRCETHDRVAWNVVPETVPCVEPDILRRGLICKSSAGQEREHDYGG